MAALLNNTGAQDLDSALRCARANGRPYPLDQLRASLADERQGVGPRKTVIRLLEAEIRRQEKAR